MVKIDFKMGSIRVRSIILKFFTIHGDETADGGDVTCVNWLLMRHPYICRKLH
jgi:hypothetical protein